MAKKNLAALMSGIMGAPEETEIVQNAVSEINIPETPANDIPVKQEEKRGKGRPRKATKSERTTLLIEPEIMRKIKYLSLVEGMTQTDIIAEALDHYITDWETHNGKIRLPRK